FRAELAVAIHRAICWGVSSLRHCTLKRAHRRTKQSAGLMNERAIDLPGFVLRTTIQAVDSSSVRATGRRRQRAQKFSRFGLRSVKREIRRPVEIREGPSPVQSDHLRTRYSRSHETVLRIVQIQRLRKVAIEHAFIQSGLAGDAVL